MVYERRTAGLIILIALWGLSGPMAYAGAMVHDKEGDDPKRRGGAPPRSSARGQGGHGQTGWLGGDAARGQ